MDVRVKLSERRKELGLTLAEIATKVGVSEATVSRWESGHIDNMKRDKITLLADALKVSPLYVMGIKNDDSENKAENKLKKIFAKNLAHFMNLYNKSQKDISDDLGYHRATVSEWVRGTKYPRMDKIECLAQYFNVRVSDLIEKHLPEFNETDISKIIDKFQSRLTQEGLTLEGSPATLENVQLIIDAMQIGLELAKKRKK